MKRLEMEQRVAELETLAANARADRSAAPDGAEALGDLLEWSRYLERMRRVEARLEERLDELRPRLAERVRAHVAARQDVKGLENLQAKQNARRAKAGERRAQETTDEAAARTKLPGPGTNDRAPGAERASSDPAGARYGGAGGVPSTQEGTAR